MTQNRHRLFEFAIKALLVAVAIVIFVFLFLEALMEPIL
jgi:hypothetical protein